MPSPKFPAPLPCGLEPGCAPESLVRFPLQDRQLLHQNHGVLRSAVGPDGLHLHLPQLQDTVQPKPSALCPPGNPDRQPNGAQGPNARSQSGGERGSKGGDQRFSKTVSILPKDTTLRIVHPPKVSAALRNV